MFFGDVLLWLSSCFPLLRFILVSAVREVRGVRAAEAITRICVTFWCWRVKEITISKSGVDRRVASFWEDGRGGVLGTQLLKVFCFQSLNVVVVARCYKTFGHQPPHPQINAPSASFLAVWTQFSCENPVGCVNPRGRDRGFTWRWVITSRMLIILAFLVIARCLFWTCGHFFSVLPSSTLPTIPPLPLDLHCNDSQARWKHSESKPRPFISINICTY